jgi:uncharacterized protein (DUF58 family)
MTREGRLVAALCVALWAVAAIGGNNLVYLVASAGLACWVLEAALGFANLRGIEVQRVLPDELFAGIDAHGFLMVRNNRRFGASGALGLTDGSAVGSVAVVPAGVERRVAVAWRFQRRGPVGLSRIEVVSAFPFGWRQRRVELRVPAEIVVFPRPLASRSPFEPAPRSGAELVAPQGGGTADLVDLRPYREGDPLRLVHAATSARLGDWFVAIRAAETVPAVWVELDPALPFEAAVGRAAGQVVIGFARGAAVGLATPEQRWPPQSGGGWRRSLLEALALLEEGR